MVNWTCIGAVALPFAGGFAGGFVTKKEIKGWYENLNKPTWRPPNWAFGPVWSVLYAGMGYASYRVFDILGGLNINSRIPLGLYGSQLLLNWAWSPIFFGAHSPKWALVDILALDAATIATAVSFYSKDKTAGLILIPYMLWLTLATTLNAWIWKNNDTKKGD